MSDKGDNIDRPAPQQLRTLNRDDHPAGTRLLGRIVGNISLLEYEVTEWSPKSEKRVKLATEGRSTWNSAADMVEVIEVLPSLQGKDRPPDNPLRDALVAATEVLVGPTLQNALLRDAEARRRAAAKLVLVRPKGWRDESEDEDDGEQEQWQGPNHCPTCGSPNKKRHPAVQADGGEAQLRPDAWHGEHVLMAEARLDRAIGELRDLYLAENATRGPNDLRPEWAGLLYDAIQLLQTSLRVVRELGS